MVYQGTVEAIAIGTEYPTSSPHLKYPTPLMGSWADVWESSRQSSEIVLEEDNLKSEQINSTEINGHVISMTRHNPYSCQEAVLEVFHCACCDCSPQHCGCMQGSASDMSNGVSESSNSFETSYNYIDVQPVSLENLSSFMPPPPPPPVTSQVFSVEGQEALHYHIVMRWYSKLRSVQQYFVSPTEICPPPNTLMYNFSEWCELIHQWWMHHFEFAQLPQKFKPGKYYHHY